jgi:hypothetical protein
MFMDSIMINLGLIFMCFSLSAVAQQNSLSLRIGPGHIARQDQTFSPFIHTDVSLLNFGLRYERQAYLHQWADLSFGFYQPMLADAYLYDEDDQTQPHSFLLVDLTYALGKQMGNSGNSDPFILGGFFKADVQPSTYNYNPFSSFGYFASFGIGIWGRYAHTINDKNLLQLTGQLPVVALIARSPYLVNDDEFIENTYSHNGFKTFFAYMGDGKIHTLNRMQQLLLNLTYTYSLNEKWKMGGEYEFQVLHSSLPTNLLQFRNVIYLRTALSF